MDGEVIQYRIAVLADDDGLIHVPYKTGWEPLDGDKHCIINPFTFAKNFELTKDDILTDRVIGKWEYDQGRSEDVFIYSVAEKKEIIKKFHLIKKMGFLMADERGDPDEIWRIMCHKNTKFPGNLESSVGEYGYIFDAEPYIIDAIKEIGIAHERIEESE